MRICFVVAEAKDGVYQPSCEKYELVVKPDTSFGALWMLSCEVVSVLQLQLSDREIDKLVVLEADVNKNAALLERALNKAVSSKYRAYIEVLPDDIKVDRDEPLISAESCRQLINRILFRPLGYDPKAKDNPPGLDASSILGIRKLYCQSPFYVLAMDATSSLKPRNDIILLELFSDFKALQDLLKGLYGEICDRESLPVVRLVQNGHHCKQLSPTGAYPETAEALHVQIIDKMTKLKNRLGEAQLFISRQPLVPHVTAEAISHYQSLCEQYGKQSAAYSTAVVVGKQGRQGHCLGACAIV